LIAAAAQDRCLSTGIAIMAFRQGDAILAGQAYEAMPEASPEVQILVFESIRGLEPQAREVFAEFLLRKGLAAGTVTPVVLAQVHRSLEGPVSEGVMEDILRAPAWSQWSAAPEGQHLPALAPPAALCPSSKRPDLREALARIESSGVTPLLQFLDILDSLEKVNPHE
jgi:hypothetical protein